MLVKLSRGISSLSGCQQLSTAQCFIASLRNAPLEDCTPNYQDQFLELSWLCETACHSMPCTALALLPLCICVHLSHQDHHVCACYFPAATQQKLLDCSADHELAAGPRCAFFSLPLSQARHHCVGSLHCHSSCRHPMPERLDWKAEARRNGRCLQSMAKAWQSQAQRFQIRFLRALAFRVPLSST